MKSKATRSMKSKRNFVPWKAERRAATKSKHWSAPETDEADRFERNEKPNRFGAGRH